MRTHCKSCGQEFKKFGYLSSSKPLCPECEDKKEQREEEDKGNRVNPGGYPFDFLFPGLWLLLISLALIGCRNWIPTEPNF